MARTRLGVGTGSVGSAAQIPPLTAAASGAWRTTPAQLLYGTQIYSIRRYLRNLTARNV